MNVPSNSLLSVGVVIPTLGRPSLVDAVRSVLDQTYPVAEIIVVVDGELSRLDGMPLPADDRIRIVSNLPKRGVSSARNTGCAALSTELIALLDDDDVWLPDKLTLQTAAYQKLLDDGYAFPVISCRWILQRPSGEVLGTAPKQLIRPGQPVADYLFVRRQLRPDGAVIAPSMTLFGAALFHKLPYREQFVRHEDWDWFLRVDQLPDSIFFALEAPLVRYTVQMPAESTSVGPGWADSWTWAEANKHLLTREQYGTFLLTVAAPIPATYGDWSGAFTLAGRALRARSGSVRAWSFFLAHVALSMTRHGKRKVRRIRGVAAASA